MKKTFKEYYSPSSKEKSKMWEEAVFIFDANILLNLYQYSKKTREEFLKILSKMGDQIWIPHQFALEYQRKRLKVIEDQSNFYGYTSQKLTKGFSSISNEIKKNQQQHPFLKIDKILDKLSRSVEKANKEIEKIENKHPDWFKKDPIRNSIDKLFNGKVGLPCKNIEDVEKEGSLRFSKKIPPGYEDSKKDYPYGDWIGWYQIIDMVKNLSSKKSVIFVTNDNKKDWWLKINDKTVGPRPELIKEISKYDIKFYMYTMEIFLDIATPIYKVKKTTIKEIGEINKKNIIEKIDIDNLSELIPPTSGVEFGNSTEEASEQKFD